MTAIALKIALPFISFGITQVFKYLWEKYLVKLPASTSQAIAALVGATLVQTTGLFGTDPVVGAILGYAAKAVHDWVTPPGQEPAK